MKHPYQKTSMSVIGKALHLAISILFLHNYCLPAKLHCNKA